MINCFNVNLHINPLKEGIDINSYGTKRRLKIPFDGVSNDLFNLMNSLNLKITDAEVFYVTPYIFNYIHTDSYGGDYVKLNFVYGGKGSYMNWYKQKPNIIKQIDNNLDYVSFNLSEVELIDSQQILCSSIVQAGIPHNVRTFGESRYCLSFVLCNLDDTRLTMNDAIERLATYTT
jgi:hypothetical protein